MLQNQLARGNNGLIKTKYLTFGIDADSLKAAKPRLERIETDISTTSNAWAWPPRPWTARRGWHSFTAFSTWMNRCRSALNGTGLAPSGLSTKDFIAPSGFEFRTGKQFRMGKKYGAVSFLQILAPELNDRMPGGFSGYGKLSDRQPAYPVRRSDQGHQDGQAENHRPG